MESKNQINLEKFLYVLRRRIVWIVLIAIMLGTGSVVATKLLVTPEYVAHAKMYVNASDSQTHLTQSDISVAKSLVDTYIVILKSDTFLEEIASTAGVDYTPAELRERMSAASVDGTEVFKVSISDTNPQKAYLIASAITEKGPQEIKRVVECGTVSIVDRPKVPTVAEGTGVVRNGILGAAIGAVISLAVFFIKEVADVTIYTEEDLTENFKYPVIGTIPSITAQTDTKPKKTVKIGSEEARS